MFRRDRRELELLDAQLDAAQARLDLSRARLARAGHRAAGSRLALLAPLTAGALTGAAVQHREPRRGGRFSAKELLTAVTAAVGVVEVIRDQALPFLTGLRGRASDGEAAAGPPRSPRPGDDAADPARHDESGDAAAAAPAATLPSPDDRGDDPSREIPWPRRVPVRMPD